MANGANARCGSLAAAAAPTTLDTSAVLLSEGHSNRLSADEIITFLISASLRETKRNSRFSF